MTPQYPVMADIDRVLIGQSPAMRRLKERLARLASIDVTTLILGPSGTGKELAARLLHEQSGRGAKPWVALNCGAIPADLFESELFGHTQGAFTGAQSAKTGLLTSAHGGTVFLDEIGELPLAMQVKLLRVLQERCIRPIGSIKEHPIDIRVIAASHQPLSSLVTQGRFRLDLLHRLSVVCIQMPAISDLRDDLLAIGQHLMDNATSRYGLGKKLLAPDAVALLQTTALPGNVRQLDHWLTSAMIWAEGEYIGARDLARALDDPSTDVPMTQTDQDEEPLPDSLKKLERVRIEQALRSNLHRHKDAAKALGISERSLRYRIGKFKEPRTSVS